MYSLATGQFQLDAISRFDYSYFATFLQRLRAPIGYGSSMTKSHRILNLTKNIRLKYSQAQRAIDNCAAAWVVEGETIRDLTLAEAIAKRNEQAKLREPMPNAELPGISYEPSTSGQSASRAGYELIMRANAFCGA